MQIKHLLLIAAVALVIGFVGGCGLGQYRASAGPVVTVVSSHPQADSARQALAEKKLSGALLVARDSILQFQHKYRNALKGWVLGDTVRSKPNAVTVIDTNRIVVLVSDTVRTLNEPAKMEYGLKLPYVLNIENKHVGLTVDIDKDSAVLRGLNLYGTIALTHNEKKLPHDWVQRSVSFARSNPYVTNFEDVYIEAPRLTPKGLLRRKIRVAAWSIPITFAATYLSMRQGWLR